ncbi:MAG TPA: hypothetical protein VF953_06885 [Terriglobales bacterium]|jgi:hypothetical protein
MRLPRAAFASFASLLLFSAVTYAANQASCTFTTFSAPAGYSLAQVNGVSDDGTVVGQLEDKNSGSFVAFSRSAAGKFTLFAPPNSTFTWFNRRNLVGVNVGSYLDTARTPHVHGLSQSGANYVEVNYPNATDTWLYGINGAGSVVGNFSKGTAIKGFKLDSGKYTVIRYPNALVTTPQAVNDSGLVVGSYFAGTLYHGFSWKTGSYKTIDYPNARFGTVLTDVNSAGVIVGNHLSADHAFGFIYQNNTMANIVYAGAKNATAGGINKNGLISGQIYFTQTNTLGYTAVCK